MRELAPDERLRAQRFRFERDAWKFSVARVTLRRILAKYLSVAPAWITFAYGPHGKPELASPRAPLMFNVSHSADLAVYAVAWNRRVGVIGPAGVIGLVGLVSGALASVLIVGAIAVLTA